MRGRRFRHCTPQSTCALADLAWLSSQPTWGALHPTPLAEALLQRHRARSAAAPSELRDQSVRIPWRAARARFAPWRTSRSPTEHVRAGGLVVVVFAADAGRAPPHTVGRGSSAPTPPQVVCYGFKTTWPKPSNSVARSLRALRSVENQPTAHGACARWRTCRGCLRGQRGDRSTPCRWARLFCTDTAPGRLLRLRNDVTKAFEFSGAQPARASFRGEPADRPQSTCALADLAWLSSQPTRGALYPTPLAQALLHRHRARSAAVASQQSRRSLRFRGAWPARASPRGEPADRPQIRCPLADLAWLSLRGQRGARSTPRRWPRLFFTVTASGRRLRLRNAVATAYEFRATRSARASPRGEPAVRPWSTRALADLAKLS